MWGKSSLGAGRTYASPGAFVAEVWATGNEEVGGELILMPDNTDS